MSPGTQACSLLKHSGGGQEGFSKREAEGKWTLGENSSLSLANNSISHLFNLLKTKNSKPLDLQMDLYLQLGLIIQIIPGFPDGPYTP